MGLLQALHLAGGQRQGLQGHQGPCPPSLALCLLHQGTATPRNEEKPLSPGRLGFCAGLTAPAQQHWDEQGGQGRGQRPLGEPGEEGKPLIPREG